MRITFALVALAACSGSGSVAPQPAAPAPSGGPPSATPAPPAGAAPIGPPVAARRVVRDTYHGVTVEDPYQWLEGETPEVAAWSEGQNRHARAVLDQLPELPALRRELTALIKAPIMKYGSFQVAGGKLFARRKDPAKEQSELVVIDEPERVSSARLVLDPTTRGGAHSAIDWFVPSPDGTRVAVSLSEGGSEAGTLHIIDLGGGDVEPPIPNVQRGTAGGDAAWTPDGKGIYYTRYPPPGEQPDAERDFWEQLWFHALGTPVASDRYELGKGLPKIAEILVDVDPRGRVLASVQNGDGGTFRHYLRDARGSWRQLTEWEDQIVYVGFGPGSDLWLISRKDAPRGKLLRLSGAAARIAEAKLVVPEGQDAIMSDYYAELGVVTAPDRVYVVYQVGGPSELRAFTHAGKPARAPALPPVSSVTWPTVWRDGVLVGATSYTTPFSWYRFTPASGALVELAELSPRPPAELSGFEVHRETASSKDGTKVPLNIVWPRGAPKDGSVPCLVTGYGGYAISQEPGFPLGQVPLLRRGVCFVEVNLRGGSEFGEDWHRAGMLTRKQNVFDDFAAALSHLVDRRYTRRDRLAIIGGSNGGLLMGALLTQHPDQVKAVVAQVGIYDMLRVERSPNGAYNVPEFGTVADEAQFKALYAYSPYHRVVPNTRYPAVLFTVGANDPRVSPWQSRKMVAALQAARAGDAPILLRTSSNSGHGAGTDTSEVIEQLADVSAFLLSQLR